MVALFDDPGSLPSAGGSGLTAGNITLGIGSVGIAASLFGGYGAMDAGKQAANYQAQAAGYSSNIAQLDMQVQAQRQQQMALDAKRNNLQQLRNAQMARMTSLSNATNSGAQFGSALSGAYGGIAGKTGNADLAIGQNLQIGKNIFSLMDQQDQYKMMYAQAESNAASAKGREGEDSGIASLGANIVGAAKFLGPLLAG